MIWPAMGGLVAAALLVSGVLAWTVLRRRDRRIGSPEEVAEAVEVSIPGFLTANAVVGANGLGALAVTSDGRVAAARRRSAGIAVREVGWGAVRSTAQGIVIETGERHFGRLTLTGVDALDIRRLAPARERHRLAADTAPSPER